MTAEVSKIIKTLTSSSAKRLKLCSLHIDNPANKNPLKIEKPDLPAVHELQPGNRAEPPQIKGPVDIPERKKEEVQLDRPHAGKQTKPVLLKPHQLSLTS